MSINVYLTITGVTGSSKVTGHVGDIEVTKWGQGYTFEKIEDELPSEPREPEYDPPIPPAPPAPGSKDDEKETTISYLNQLHEYLKRQKTYEENFEKEKREYEDSLKKFNQEKSLLLEDEASAGDKAFHGFDKSKDMLGSGLERLKQHRIQSRSQHEPFSFSKLLDKSSNTLMLYCWQGKRFTATFKMYRPVDPASSSLEVSGAAYNYLEVKLENAYVADYSISGDGEDWPEEDIELQYEKATYSFIATNPKTPAKTTIRRICWEWGKGKATPS